MFAFRAYVAEKRVGKLHVSFTHASIATAQVTTHTNK